MIESKFSQYVGPSSNSQSNHCADPKVFENSRQSFRQLVHGRVGIRSWQRFGSLALPWRFDVTKGQMADDLLHVLVVEERREAGLVVQSNVVEGHDDGAVCSWSARHDAVDFPIRSLNILLRDLGLKDRVTLILLQDHG